MGDAKMLYVSFKTHVDNPSICSSEGTTNNNPSIQSKGRTSTSLKTNHAGMHANYRDPSNQGEFREKVLKSYYSPREGVQIISIRFTSKMAGVCSARDP